MGRQHGADLDAGAGSPHSNTLVGVMADTLNAVLLDSRAPPELLALVKDYVKTHDPEMKFLLCTGVVPVGAFLQCELLQNESRKLWRLQIPTGYVVAIAEISSEQKSLGFL